MFHIIICIVLAILHFALWPVAAQENTLDSEMQKIQNYVKEKEALILATEKGILRQTIQNHSWELLPDRNYRIFLVASRPLDEVHAKIQYDGEKLAPPKLQRALWEDMEYYQCSIMTFRRIRIYITLAYQPSEDTPCSYLLVLASAGKEMPREIKTKGADRHGNVYELIDNVVYRNNRQFYKPHQRYKLTELCVTPDSRIFMLTEEGSVLSSSGILYKGRQDHNQTIIKMISSRESHVYFFREDGAVLDREGHVMYKNYEGNKAVELLELDGTVWILCQNGKRIKLR